MFFCIAAPFSNTNLEEIKVKQLDARHSDGVFSLIPFRNVY